MSSSFLQLVVGSCDLSQAEKEITEDNSGNVAIFTQNDKFVQGSSRTILSVIFLICSALHSSYSLLSFR